MSQSDYKTLRAGPELPKTGARTGFWCNARPSPSSGSCAAASLEAVSRTLRVPANRLFE